MSLTRLGLVCSICFALPTYGETPAAPGMCEPALALSTLTAAQKADPLVAQFLLDQEKLSTNCAKLKSLQMQASAPGMSAMQEAELKLEIGLLGDKLQDATHHEFLRGVQRDLFSWQQVSLWAVTAIVLGGSLVTLLVSLAFLTLPRFRKGAGKDAPMAVEVAGIVKLSSDAAWVTAMGVSIAFLYLFLHEAMNLKSGNFANFADASRDNGKAKPSDATKAEDGTKTEDKAAAKGN